MKETGQDLIKKILYLINTNTEKSYNTFLEKFESLLENYTPLKIFLKIN